MIILFNMGEYKKDFTYTEVEILINIYFSTDEKYLTQSSLARHINTAPTNPIYARIFKYLVENEIIELRNTIGNSMLLEIDERKLRDLIDDCEVVEHIFSYLEDAHTAMW